MGRKKEIADEDLLDGLVRVFQTFGYEGASMSRLAEATGLGRASLYHRFPGGKEEMALAALKRADQVFAHYVLAPLTEPGEPKARIRRTAKRMAEYYGLARTSCLLDTLSMGEVEHLREPVQNSFASLRQSLVRIARETGATPAQAKKRTERAILELHGALIWARASQDTHPFQRVMKNLPRYLTTDAAE